MLKRILIISCMLCALQTLNFAQQGIPKRGYALDWLYPKTMGSPQISKFAKIELGIALHDTLSKEITNFIKNGSGLNPFNPDDLDLYAEFSVHDNSKATSSKRINAFYFEDFRRNTADANLEKWNWVNLNTPSKFRIRFTPDAIGTWQFQVFIRVKNKEIVKLGPYTFTCVESDLKGFVKVAADNRYLELGGESFMPIGQNLPKPSCAFEKDASGKVVSDPYGCEKCPCAGIEDWCGHLRHLPMLPKPYMVYLEQIEKFKEAGGNYFRMISFPFTYDIEYEKLGNYTNRLHCAWELDQMVNKAEELDLKVHFDLFIGYSVVKAPYGTTNWDWYADGADDPGYCYAKELGLTEPHQFLTNEQARKHYKNKLRYMIARWGYSPAIAVLEMMSEINNKFSGYAPEIYQWQKEMARYIKEDLQHSNQLLTVSYDGGRPKIKQGDYSFSIPHLDILTHNIHRAAIERGELQDAYLRYAKHNKPLIFSEIGTGDIGFQVCDKNTEWIKDLWLTLFSGTASAGINWNEFHNVELWKHMQAVQQYTKDIQWTNFSELQHRNSKNKLVEVVALYDPLNDNSVGAVQNLTWNYASNNTGGDCEVKDQPEEQYRNFTEVEAPAKKGVYLKKTAKKKTYQIDWYSPKTGQLISSSTVSSKSSGKLELPHPNLTADMPFVLYKLYPKDKGFTGKNKKSEPNK